MQLTILVILMIQLILVDLVILVSVEPGDCESFVCDESGGSVEIWWLWLIW